MKCEDYRGLLPEYWEGGLEDEDRATLEMHLASCPVCRSEAETLGNVWHGLARIPQAQPSRELRTRFYEKLDAYQHGFTEAGPVKKKSGFSEWLNSWWVGRPALQIGFSAALLVLGVGFGYALRGNGNKGPDPQVAQLDHLRTELTSMRQMVTLSLLQQQSASDRLKGVSWAYRVEESDTQVLSALLFTINHDSNVNVRLAAIDALRTFGDSPVARKGLRQAIGKQDSPLAQIAIIDMLVELKDKESTPTLDALSKDEKASKEARERATWALGKLG